MIYCIWCKSYDLFNLHFLKQIKSSFHFLAGTIKSIVHAKLTSGEHAGFHGFRKRLSHKMKPSYVIFIFLNFQRESSRSFNKEAIRFACQILIIFFGPSRWRYGVSFHPSEPITKLITKMTVPSIVIDFKNPIFH